MLQIDSLIEYWKNKFQANKKGNIISFDNRFGTGTMEVISINSAIYCLSFDLNLKKDFNGNGEGLVDDNGYISLLFGRSDSTDKRFLEFDFEEKINLDGVIITNDKNGMQWYIPSGTPLKLLLIKVSPHYMETICKKSTFLQNRFPLDKSFVVFDSLNSIMSGVLLRIFEIEDELFQNEMKKACVEYLLPLTFSKFSKLSEVNDKITESLTSLFEARQIIIQEKGNINTIDLLAKEVGLSVSRLRLMFKNSFGISIYKFQQHVRLEEAKKMLLDGNKTMSMIAMDLGFSTASHFTSVFKKQYDMLPKEYRIKAKK